MYLIVEANPNCAGEERVFKENGLPRGVKRVLIDQPNGTSAWTDVTGVDEEGTFIPAHAIQVDDSSAGSAWLVHGGLWGLRFRKDQAAWSLDNGDQWGEPFKVMDISGAYVEFDK
jgi:hypothetical protein